MHKQIILHDKIGPSSVGLLFLNRQKKKIWASIVIEQPHNSDNEESS